MLINSPIKALFDIIKSKYSKPKLKFYSKQLKTLNFHES